MTIIKKTADKNQYILVEGGYWVRDFGSRAYAVDINNLYSSSDQKLVIGNEAENRIWNIPQIDTERVFYPNLAIISDGYDYQDCIPLIKELGKQKIPCIGTHSVLTKWEQGIRYNYYLVNNPTAECMSFIPKKNSYVPNCIASVRTNSDFVRRYRAKGTVMYWYTPTPSKSFRSKFYSPMFFVDDYRNAICGAVSLACRWQVAKLLLIAPHDLYTEIRPSAEKLSNGFYIYPQQRMAHKFIDASLYWLNKYNECDIGAVTSGPSFNYAKQLTIEEAVSFFST